MIKYKGYKQRNLSKHYVCLIIIFLQINVQWKKQKKKGKEQNLNKYPLTYMYNLSISKIICNMKLFLINYIQFYLHNSAHFILYKQYTFHITPLI